MRHNHIGSIKENWEFWPLKAIFGPFLVEKWPFLEFLFNKLTRMGFRRPEMSRLKGWCCGPSDRSDSCPSGERLAGACCHCSSAVYMAGVLANNPNVYSSTNRSCHIIDRANVQAANTEIVGQVLS